ncbi:dubious [Schizosaccharomyces pombe]|uniref:Uncharacterized membrane protein C17A2.10c n=1 Tax=Schizosaccharomyces pombe (strain 972 / ATCC 24843) TaxID=284812 RepID=YF2A_SCHPO|nr:uncharacterized protein SPAC17A2.10c [Schizosaccharomyces pombe]O13760.1 RecName: Full=Uncharacterized membrane protein C17A2.10c; Flags: Precursor [Schizosaccharomyces pombe 972h-]CAB16563.1 sequence orphan [Schizosaccharomyces pombe]|eukprot:NP_594244.1 uncharacterized protein SPAC17A2.10c [Schizosaccharomyces pombe]
MTCVNVCFFLFPPCHRNKITEADKSLVDLLIPSLCCSLAVFPSIPLINTHSNLCLFSNFSHSCFLFCTHPDTLPTSLSINPKKLSLSFSFPLSQKRPFPNFLHPFTGSELSLFRCLLLFFFFLLFFLSFSFSFSFLFFLSQIFIVYFSSFPILHFLFFFFLCVCVFLSFLFSLSHLLSLAILFLPLLLRVFSTLSRLPRLFCLCLQKKRRVLIPFAFTSFRKIASLPCVC